MLINKSKCLLKYQNAHQERSKYQNGRPVPHFDAATSFCTPIFDSKFLPFYADLSY